MQVNYGNEQLAARAFSKQALVFDALYADNAIVGYKRSRVRAHLLQYVERNSLILELNAGTGDDAIYMAQHGCFVHATDISTGMQEQLKEKVSRHGLEARISQELCSYTALDQLTHKGPYDCLFSNFAGLNCTGQLSEVLHRFADLLKPGGMVVLVVLPPFCLWETLLLFRGKFRTATRRFFSAKGRKANIDGEQFKCWYYSPGYIIKHLQDGFDVVNLEGLCSFVPPSYIEGFAEKYPRLLSLLQRCEHRLKGRWPWKFIGDYYIITLRRKQ